MPAPDIETGPVNRATLTGYAAIPSGYTSATILKVTLREKGLKGLSLQEIPVDPPYVKNYDAAESPLRWLRFNTQNWRMFRALVNGEPAGGLIIACRTPELRMLNGRDDLADVWDIRVRPEYQRQGVGVALFRAAAAWSRSQGYRQLCVETQNTNVRACRFYLSRGCVLGGVNRYAYYDSPDCEKEVQLLWFLDL